MSDAIARRCRRHRSRPPLSATVVPPGPTAASRCLVFGARHAFAFPACGEQVKALRKEARARESKVVLDVLRSRNVVLATCVGAATHSLKDEEFDLIVIDEAAQVERGAGACYMCSDAVGGRGGGGGSGGSACGGVRACARKVFMIIVPLTSFCDRWASSPFCRSFVSLFGCLACFFGTLVGPSAFFLSHSLHNMSTPPPLPSENCLLNIINVVPTVVVIFSVHSSFIYDFFCPGLGSRVLDSHPEREAPCACGRPQAASAYCEEPQGEGWPSCAIPAASVAVFIGVVIVPPCRQLGAT